MEKTDANIDKRKQESQQPKSRLATLILVTILVLAVVGVVVLLLLRSDKKTQNNTAAFTINGQKYTKQYYDSLLNAAVKDKVSQAKAKTEIITVTKEQYAAKSLNINILSSKAEQAARSQFAISASASPDSYQSLVGWDVAFQDYLSLVKSGGYQGSVFYFPFDQLQVISLPNLPKPAGWGNTTDIAEAQSYAQSQANNYYAKLKANTMTADKVISVLMADPKLQFAGSSNGSMDFSINFQGNNPITTTSGSSPLDASAIALIQNYNKVGLTPIETESYSYPADLTYNGQTTPMLSDYYFIDIQQILKANPAIQTSVNQKLSNLVIKTYV